MFLSATSQNKEKFEDYEGFVEKFKPKKTTDDCYTPPLVYSAIADWAANEYNLDKKKFVRPFYPNGDYQKADYSNGKIVVDNPPFSILTQIVKFYVENHIKFFLFAPTLTNIRLGDVCTVLVVGVGITYDNGAVINTSFVTNLEPHEIRVRTAPTLYQVVKTANEQQQREQKRSSPKYVYPPELITAAQMYTYNKYGIDLVIPRNESYRVGRLDSQKESKKGIFGNGLLLSSRLTAEREKAEHWKLSKREKRIIQALDEKEYRKNV